VFNDEASIIHQSLAHGLQPHGYDWHRPADDERDDDGRYIHSACSQVCSNPALK